MTIWIMEIEAHEQRYSGEWQTHLPSQIKAAASAQGRDDTVKVIGGGTTSGQTTPGAFLDFAETNVFKSEQTAQVARLFKNGHVQQGDCFLFADAWHFGVFAVRYMSELLHIPVRTVGLFHAGSYDPHDFLGRIPDRRWSSAFERALFEAYEVSCFATEFHANMFREAFGISDDARIQQVGWPMEYLPDAIGPHAKQSERNLVLFPHRIAPEKQVSIFHDLAMHFPDYEFVVCQDQMLTKADYHRLLGEAKVIFSASLQETLGIGCYEGLLAGAIPLAPDRLSYSEMYPEAFLYPSDWTLDWDSYQMHKQQLVGRLHEALRFQESRSDQIKSAAERVGERFFDGGKIYQILLDS